MLDNPKGFKNCWFVVTHEPMNLFKKKKKVKNPFNATNFYCSLAKYIMYFLKGREK